MLDEPTNNLWDSLDSIEVTVQPLPAPPSRKGHKLRLFLWLVAAVLTVIAVGIGYVYWQAETVLNEFHAGGKEAIIQAAKSELGVAPAKPFDTNHMGGYFITNADNTAAQEQGAETILLIGSDRRWGETDRGRSDTMMLMRVVPQAHMISILSIPRDLRVPIPGYGYDKINAAFSYGGERLLIATIRNYFGVKIDHFVEVSFRGFGDLITALGGVYIPVDQRYYVPPNSGFMQIDLQPGYQLLKRNDALSFVRFRHYDSDFYRAARQQIFLREVERQVIASRYDLFKMQDLIHAFAKATTTDIDSIGALWNLVDALRSTPADQVQRLTVSGASQMIGGVDYVIEDTALHNRTVAQWYHPEWIIKKQQSLSRSIKPTGRHAAPPLQLQADGLATSIIRSYDHGLQACAPTKIIPGYYWPQGAARSYLLAGHQAEAAYETAGSGRSVLWMFTTWGGAPILDSPSETIRRNGVTYNLYFESGALHQIAWKIGSTSAWVSNTLKDELSIPEMMALAESCQPLN